MLRFVIVSLVSLFVCTGLFSDQALARKGKSQSRPPAQGEYSNSTSTRSQDSERKFSCRGKTKCAQMESCAEAYFYLRQCGLRRLDRDNDGVPCESICR